MSDDRSKFASEDMPELDDYRPVSILALVALLFSLLSPLVIFHIGLTAIPVFSFLMAVAAIYQSRGVRQYVGTSAATIAVILSAFAITWSISYRVSREYSVVSNAKQFSAQWLELVKAEEIYQVYELSLHYGARHKKNMDLELLYTVEPAKEDPVVFQRKLDMGIIDPSAKDRFESYFSKEPLKQICANINTLSFEYVTARYIDWNPDRDRIGLLYRAVGEGAPDPQEFLIEMERYKVGNSVHWRVAQIKFPSDPTPTDSPKST